jgi:hypothetical protein
VWRVGLSVIEIGRWGREQCLWQIRCLWSYFGVSAIANWNANPGTRAARASSCLRTHHNDDNDDDEDDRLSSVARALSTCTSFAWFSIQIKTQFRCRRSSLSHQTPTNINNSSENSPTQGEREMRVSACWKSHRKYDEAWLARLDSHPNH